MTLKERQVTIAYERILDICEKCQQILKSDAFEILSHDRKRDFVIAEDALLRVKYEFQAFVSKHTDYRLEKGKTGKGKVRRINAPAMSEVRKAASGEHLI